GSSNVDARGMNCTQVGKYSPLAVVPSAPVACSCASMSPKEGFGLTGGCGRGYRNGIEDKTSSAQRVIETGRVARSGSTPTSCAPSSEAARAAMPSRRCGNWSEGSSATCSHSQVESGNVMQRDIERTVPQKKVVARQPRQPGRTTRTAKVPKSASANWIG